MIFRAAAVRPFLRGVGTNDILFPVARIKLSELKFMEKNILVLDVGNTQAKARPVGPDGFLGPEERVSGHKVFDAEAWSGWLERAAAGSGPAALVFASVVPPADPLIREAAAGLGWTALAVPGDLPVPMENRYQKPWEVGADRLVGSYAARRRFPGEERLIVVDFGTATTFDCIRGDALLGGLICPGLLSSARSLHVETAKLPLPTLELSSDRLRIDVGTMESLNQGLLFGAAAQVEGLASRLAEVMGGPAFVAATGGLAPSVARVCPAIRAVLPDLMFEGLAALYRRRAG